VLHKTPEKKVLQLPYLRYYLGIKLYVNYYVKKQQIQYLINIFSLVIILILHVYFFTYTYKWGRYKPENRYNVDQVPLPFTSKPKRVIDDIGASQVWVSMPAPGLEKRQYSLILTIRGDGKY
jgi:hypothetical protein